MKLQEQLKTHQPDLYERSLVPLAEGDEKKRDGSSSSSSSSSSSYSTSDEGASVDEEDEERTIEVFDENGGRKKARTGDKEEHACSPVVNEAVLMQGSSAG